MGRAGYAQHSHKVRRQAHPLGRLTIEAMHFSNAFRMLFMVAGSGGGDDGTQLRDAGVGTRSARPGRRRRTRARNHHISGGVVKS
eukprot:2563748-Prymnesium_polylepis.1